MNGAQSCNPLDPLQDYTGLAFFPPSFRGIPDISSPYEFHHHLHALHTQLKSMASEILKSDNPQALKQKNGVGPATAEDNPRERRPALGRKRARFSMKPSTSQISMDLLPPFDPEKYEDLNLEEQLKARERHKNAEKEIKKRMGVLGADQYNPSPTKRTRRPGMLGRSVKDKYSFPLSSFVTSENGVSSQDTFETSIHSPLNHSSHIKVNDNGASEEMELAVFTGSTAKAKNNVKGNLDELLSGDCEDLEGNKVFSILQDLFKIKPVEVEPLSPLKFPSKKKFDIKSSRSTLPRPTNVLADIDNLVKPVKHKKVPERSIHLASPTLPKSPLASISALNKRTFESNPSGNPFSAHDIDKLPVTNPPLVENGNKQSELVDMGEQTAVSDDTLSSPDADTDTWENGTKDGDKIRLEDTLAEAVASAEPELNVADSTLKKLNDTQIQLDQLHSAAVEEHPTEGLPRNVDTGPETHNEITQEHSGVSLNKQIKANSRPRRKRKSKEVSKRQSLAAAVEEHLTDGLSRNVDTGPETHNERMQEHSGVSLSTQTKSNSRPCRKQKTKEVSESQILPAVEEHPADDLSRNVDTGLATQNEIMQEHSGVSLNTRIESNSRRYKKQKRKEVSKRHSLAGAGTSWQAGVRRSTRIKTRPLEYWRGERLLYGRIYESMATVIGIKYASPGKGDEAPLKVKSFVSDEYKELVELAALH